ncbi:MAG: hypothetical protein ACTTKQ_00355 [Filifactor alocis]|uniref:hypothetical protein n=1 Tax=Filifactor alocis TaxID=143361 RepID=UPI003F9EF884
MFKLKKLNLVVETDSTAKKDELIAKGYETVEGEAPSVVLKSSEETKADEADSTETGKETISEGADKVDLEKLYKKYTVDQLRALADEKGKTFDENMSKKDLFNLVFGE